MIFGKTQTMKIKKIYRDKCDWVKTKALYRITTYWFLFIPVFTHQEFID